MLCRSTRARLVRDVLSQDSDVLFGCERRESLNERTRTRIASAHEVLVSLSLGGWQDYKQRPEHSENHSSN